MTLLFQGPQPAQAMGLDTANGIEVADASPGSLKKMSLAQLMDLDVTSVSKQPQPFGQAPAALQVITGDGIRRSGASSLPEALRLADNLDVAQKNSHDWGISARGFNTDSANKLLVLIDGRGVYTPLFSGVFWDVQDSLLEDIDRIEVISGPGGTLWGANAVNGVINVISKGAKDTQGLYWEEGYGEALGNFVGTRYGGTLAPDVFFRVYGKHFYKNGEVLPDGSRAFDNWNMTQGGFRVDALASPEETFTLQGDLYGGDQNNLTTGDARTNGGNLIGRWSRSWADNSSVQLQLYFDRTELFAPEPAKYFGPFLAVGAGILHDDLKTYDLDFQHQFHLDDRNNLIWGLGCRFTNDDVQNAPSIEFVPTTLNHVLYSGFIQDEFTFWEGLSLTVGSKVEHNDYTGWEFEPGARAKWDIASGQMVWGSVSRAVRMPSRIDRDLTESLPGLSFLGITDLLVGDPDFISETVMVYELGYRAQLTGNWSISASSFFNNYQDIRSAANSPPPAPFGLPIMFQNDLDAQTGGIEIASDLQVLDPWRLHVGYDLLEESVWVAPGGTDINHALNETADPRHQFFLRSSTDLLEGVQADAAFRFIDSLTLNNNGSPAVIPSYVELDLRLGWQVTQDLELSLVGRNLLHDHHQEYMISPPLPVEEIQRSIYGKVALRY